MKQGLVKLPKILTVTLLFSGCAGLGAHPMGWGTHSMFHDTRGDHRMTSGQPCPDIPRERKDSREKPC